MRLVVFGIALSIPIVVWGSGVLAALMNRHAWIILVAGGILGEVAGKMILHDTWFRQQVGTAPGAVEWGVRLSARRGDRSRRVAHRAPAHGDATGRGPVSGTRALPLAPHSTTATERAIAGSVQIRRSATTAG